MPTEVDLPAIQRGDTVPYQFNWTSSAAPWDMRGKTLVMTFKVSPVVQDSDSHLIKTVEYAADDAAAEAGVTEFQLESSETAQLHPGLDYHYGLRILDTSTDPVTETTMLYGIIPVGDV